MYLDYFGYYLYNIVTFFALYLIIFKRDWVIQHKKEVMTFLLALLLYSQYHRYGARLFIPSFSYPIDSLPIHFCRVSALMTLLYLITRNKIIKGFVFFQAGLGFLSVLIPGGYFFIMTQDWRSLAYMWDHFILAIMPFFLVFIDGYRIQKRDFIISLVYSAVVPLLVLPIALATNYDAYYVLDGVFIRDIFGDNQFVISSVLLVLLVMYNILMLYAGKVLIRLREKTYKHENNLWKPLYPWLLVSTFLVGGILVGIFYVRPIPFYLKIQPVAYVAKPIQVYGEDIVVYAGTGCNDEIYYFFESLKDEHIKVYDQDGNLLEQKHTDMEHTTFVNTAGLAKNQLIVVLIINEGQDNETIKTYTFTAQTDLQQFYDNVSKKLIYN